MKVKDFILSNKNIGVKWNIDGENYANRSNIPSYIMEKYLYEWTWTVNEHETVVLLMTYLS